MINVVSDGLRGPMVQSSADAELDVDEAATLGLETTPSTQVAPGRASPAPSRRSSAGCTAPTGSTARPRRSAGWCTSTSSDDVIRDGRVDPTLLAPVARLGASLYTTVTEAYRLERPRPGDAPW